VHNIKVKYGIFDDDLYNFDKIEFIIGIIIAFIVVTTLNSCSRVK